MPNQVDSLEHFDNINSSFYQKRCGLKRLKLR